MRPWIQALGVAGLVLVLGFLAGRQQNGRPHRGETVTPGLELPVHWMAGTSGDLGVRLYAREVDAKATRLLDFSAMPLGVNPMANIAFYSEDQLLSSLAIALSHRC